MSPASTAPTASVFVISDFAVGEESAWDDIRAALRALAHQDFAEPAEYFLLERASVAERIPEDLPKILPGLRIVLSQETSSYALKNETAEHASADLVAILDADCIPDSDWLRRLVAALRADPQAAVVSTKTEYRGRTLLERILSLLSRAFVDPGKAGETRFLTNNSAIFRRADMLRNPLPTAYGPFAARIQMESFRRAGRAMLFEPRTRVIHAFHGWPMERDIRRNFGYGAVLIRLADRRLPFAWLTRIGLASIPLFVLFRTADSWWNCVRVGPRYGVAWYQVPLALGVAVLVHLLEVPGMLRAFRGAGAPGSSFR